MFGIKVIVACVVVVIVLLVGRSKNKSRGGGLGVTRSIFRGISTIDLWQQCGGKGGDCAKYNACEDAPWPMTTCGPGAMAVRHNEWHWQCEPVGSQQQEAAASKQLGWGEQCGGKGGDCAKKGQCVDAQWHGVKCPQFSACIRRNEWHWQCDPEGMETIKELGWGEQCGGQGGDCKSKGQCVDAQWKGVKCPQFSACIRRNEWHWQCDPEPKPEQPQYPSTPTPVQPEQPQYPSTPTPVQPQPETGSKSFQPPPELSRAKLMLKWSDEFSLDRVDEAKWEFHEGDGTDWTGVKGWGNQEMQCYSCSPENIRIENNVLIITAKRGGTCRNAKNNTHADASITSAKLASRQAFVFGDNPILVSARIKIPMGQGSFPAFWLIPNRPWSSGTGAYGYWCLSGEIDILEHVNKEKHVQSTVIHKLPEDPECKFDRQGIDLADPGDWHVYSCLWSKDEIKTWVDGQPMLTKNTGFGRPFTAENPMNIVLNLAVGGSWAGNDASDLPYSMYVDYVYVHDVINSS